MLLSILGGTRACALHEACQYVVSINHASIIMHKSFHRYVVMCKHDSCHSYPAMPLSALAWHNISVSLVHAPSVHAIQYTQHEHIYITMQIYIW